MRSISQHRSTNSSKLNLCIYVVATDYWLYHNKNNNSIRSKHKKIKKKSGFDRLFPPGLCVWLLSEGFIVRVHVVRRTELHRRLLTCMFGIARCHPRAGDCFNLKHYTCCRRCLNSAPGDPIHPDTMMQCFTRHIICHIEWDTSAVNEDDCPKKEKKKEIIITHPCVSWALRGGV